MDNKLSIHPGLTTPLFKYSGPFVNIGNIADRDKTQSRRLHEPTCASSHCYS